MPFGHRIFHFQSPSPAASSTMYAQCILLRCSYYRPNLYSQHSHNPSRFYGLFIQHSPQTQNKNIASQKHLLQKTDKTKQAFFSSFLQQKHLMLCYILIIALNTNKSITFRHLITTNQYISSLNTVFYQDVHL